jgi:hypothetical protein
VDVLGNPHFTAEFWGWAARLASVAGIVGGLAGVAALGLAFVQLRHIQRDQKRIADELTKGPRLVLFFAPPYGAPSSTETDPVALLRPTWAPGAALCDPIELRVSIGNLGERTARGVRCNVYFPGVVARVTAPQHDVQVEPAGNLYVITTPESANPGTALHYPLFLVVARVDSFTGRVTASLEDRPAYSWNFRVILAAETA